jgi:transcription-repair coupling factor (superfamily II helicase)
MKLGVIHGQMHAKDIEKIMWKFTNMELDVLVATTIIESGLDIPSVNTMIVEESENFGLSQLYQLRGRIGRDRKKAYCYLFYKDKTLNDDNNIKISVITESKKKLQDTRETENYTVLYSGVNRYTTRQSGVMIWIHK